MENNNFDGLDAELQQEETSKESNITSLEEAKKKRKPFHYWTVDGVNHKMKLTTDMILMLENKYHVNVMSLVLRDDTPPISVMLTIAQAAISPWEHGMKYEKVKAMYDKWLEEDGSQTDFLTKIIIPTMAVSGFFTAEQTETILKNIDQAMDMM